MGYKEVASMAALGGVSVAAATYYWLSRPRRILPSEKSQNEATVAAAPLPGTAMRRLIVTQPDQDLDKVKMVVETTTVPELTHGQVLVQMKAVPVHPSDYNEWRAKNGGIGHEGCGIVVASGGGVWANRLVGRRVGVMLSRSGTVAEYICCHAMREVFALPVSNQVALQDCASWFVNPFTAISILDTAKSRHQARVLIQTAASSQLGQMLIQLAPSQGMTLVNVVRKKEQWKMLKNMGATHVICTADEDWMTQLKAVIKTLDIRVAFDAVSGDMTGALMTCLPSRSTVYVYGILAGEPVAGVDPIDLIYRRKEVRGFHVGKDWLSRGGPAVMLNRLNRNLQIVGPGLEPGGWATSAFVDCSMDTMHETFCDLWKNGFTGKKLRILF